MLNSYQLLGDAPSQGALTYINIDGGTTWQAMIFCHWLPSGSRSSKIFPLPIIIPNQVVPNSRKSILLLASHSNPTWYANGEDSWLGREMQKGQSNLVCLKSRSWISLPEYPLARLLLQYLYGYYISWISGSSSLFSSNCVCTVTPKDQPFRRSTRGCTIL